MEKEENNFLRKYKDPRWQKKRLEILKRDDWTCRLCVEKEETLHVHHRLYKKDTDPWDYPSHLLVTMCENCHKREKELMKDTLNILCDVMQERFFAETVFFIAEAFKNIPPIPFDESELVVATAIEWFMSNLFNEKSGLMEKQRVLDWDTEHASVYFTPER